VAVPSPLIANLLVPGLLPAVERRHDPRLRGRPLAIGGRPGTPARLAAVSDEARACGVLPGMTADAARRACPHAVFLEGDIERYLDAQADIDALLRRVVPGIEWEALDSAWLAMPAAGNAPRLLDAVRQRLRDSLDLEMAGGIARTRFTAGVAARLASPRGWLYVIPRYEVAFLRPVHLALLEPEAPAFVARCRRAGLVTLGDVAALPPEALRATCGRAGTVWAGFAAGLDDRPVRVGRPPSRLIARADVPPLFGSEPAPLEPAVWRAVIESAAAVLAAQLEGLGLTAHALTVRVECATSTSTIVKSGLLPRAIQRRVDIAAAALDLLGTATPPAATQRVTLVAGGVTRDLTAPRSAPNWSGRGVPLLASAG
jgi:DNA polymerase IV